MNENPLCRTQYLRVCSTFYVLFFFFFPYKVTKVYGIKNIYHIHYLLQLVEYKDKHYKWDDEFLSC